MTHALQMSGVGDFRYYDDYELWPTGTRGDLASPDAVRRHVERVFAVQDQLGVPHLAPTVLLSAPLSNQSDRALEVARIAASIDPNAAQSIAGTGSFWSGGGDLDAHIGSVASVEAPLWFVTVVRPLVSMPVMADAKEVFGLCRTARALSEDAAVHISHGDLAALPAVAAGATSVGTGWDQRQRQCCQADYQARDTSGAGGGGWFERPTIRGLIGLLKDSEGDLLRSRDSGRLARLGTLPAPGPKERYLHHVDTLHGLVSLLLAEGDPENRFTILDSAYDAAQREWPEVQRITGCAAGADEWIAPLQEGLRDYARLEGWI